MTNNIHWLCITIIVLYIELKLILTIALWERCSYWTHFTHKNIIFPFLTLTSCQHCRFWPLSFLRPYLPFAFHHPASPGLPLHSLIITFPFSKLKKIFWSSLLRYNCQIGNCWCFLKFWHTNIPVKPSSQSRGFFFFFNLCFLLHSPPSHPQCRPPLICFHHWIKAVLCIF